jgi:hypothetical protein
MIWSFLSGLFQSLLSDAAAHPLDWLARGWTVLSGIAALVWAGLKFTYKFRRERRLNARNFLDFLEGEPVLYMNRDSELSDKVYGAAQRIRQRVNDVLPKTQSRRDREDLKEIRKACIEFTNDVDAFPKGQPKEGCYLTTRQWDALNRLRNEVTRLAVAIAAHHNYPKPTLLQTWESLTGVQAQGAREPEYRTPQPDVRIEPSPPVDKPRKANLMTITSPSGASIEVAAPGQRVSVSRDPYDEPLPVEGLITEVSVKEAVSRFNGPFYIELKLRTDEGHTRVFSLEDVFCELVEPPKAEPQG